MPRKKNVTPESAPEEQQKSIIEPLAKRLFGRRKKLAHDVEAPSEASASIESAAALPTPLDVTTEDHESGKGKPTGRRGKPATGKRVAEKAPTVAEATSESGETETAQPERVRSRRRGAKPPQAVTAEITPLDVSDLGPDIPVPTFRPRASERPAQPEIETGRRGRQNKREQSATQPKQAVPAGEGGERKGKGRSRGPRPEPKPFVPFELPPLPARPMHPLISVPDDAPQVVLRDGVPTLVRNHEVIPPIAFFGSASDEKRSLTVLDEMRMAGEAGVHIHSHLVEFEVDPRNVEGSVKFAAYMLKQTLAADPDAQVLFRVVFIAPAGWPEMYPEARYDAADGALAEPSVSDDKFWEAAKECLKRFVKQLRMLDARDHILGVHLERGEWFYAQGWGYDTSIAARNKFRDWVRVRYRNDVVALRAAWFDGGVNFNTLGIPGYKGDGEQHEKFMRSSRRERRWVDYHLFLSDAVVERVGDLAYATKEASEGYFLVGASYGYTFEWSHPASGHLSLGKLLRTNEIDFIAGPPSYRSRQPSGAAPFPGPIDSFALNGKLYISEEDFKTSIGGAQEPDDFNPVIKTPQSLESVHWRGAGSALAHASGICWMDLWGNGWLKTSAIWKRAGEVRESLIRRMSTPLQDPDVAVFIDERGLAYLVDEEAFALLVQNVRETVLRSGLNAAFYLLSDLQHREKFPESKLYVFLNAWDIRPELRVAIKNRLQRDNKVLFWIYAAGLFDSGRESLERAREVTGIALKPQPFHSKSGTTILNRRHPLCEAFPERGIVGGARMEPSYFAIPEGEDSMVLGEYSQTGLPSFVVKEFNRDRPAAEHWTSVFLGEPIVTPALMRALAHMAGAHVWNYQDDVVHVRPPFLTVHCTGAGSRTVTLPNKWAAYDLVEQDWASSDSSSLRFQATDGSTHLFLTGSKVDLDQILNAPPDKMLRMEELPPKPDNTVRFDAVSFDVPIMKLDEWIEVGEQDEGSDEFLFRPKFFEEPEAEQESNGNGRRRRRGRDRNRDREGTEETANVRVDGEQTSFDEQDMEMNVVFRRRK